MTDVKRPITDLFNTTPSGDDWTDMGPTHVCICGCDLFHVLMSFEDRVPSFYFTDGMCADCGALIKVPTEVDEDPK